MAISRPADRPGSVRFRTYRYLRRMASIKTEDVRGRPVHETLAQLAQAASPDPAFAADMEAVLESVGPTPADPWAQS
jgi:hypothetical protein